MTLRFYSKTNEDAELNEQNPFAVTFDGRIGGAQDKLVYLRNDSFDHWYNLIKVSVVDTDGIDIVDGSESGWSWKLATKDIAPTFEEWAEVSAGNTLTIGTQLGTSSLADTITYIPIWVRVEIPRGQRIQTITDVVLRINATENLVDG